MKRLFFGIILALVIMVISRTPQARVTGVCADCHTMHNSQGGKTMSVFYGDSRYTDDPLECLLVGDCVGCHTSTDGGASGIAGAPAVFSASAPDYGATIGDGKYAGLAAGNFPDRGPEEIFTEFNKCFLRMPRCRRNS